jgi:transcription antitermination factor NusB
MRRRTRARELALQLLYQVDIRGDELESIIGDFWENQIHDSDELDQQIKDFATKLAKGSIANLKDIDAVISSYTQNWQLERMAAIDRNVMRMACYELLYLDDIPPKVSINEAVDLAKKYGDTESGKFVNGILDKINKKQAKFT